MRLPNSLKVRKVSGLATLPAYTVVMTAADSAHLEGFEPYQPGKTPSGMVVLRASRLEALVPQLFDLMGQLPPDDILAPHTVIAAHAGMRQWLLAALARHAGPGGIIANIDVQLTSTWVDSEAKRLLGRPAIQLPRYQPDHLRWRILDVLEDPKRAGMQDARLSRYLAPVPEDQAGELAVRRFQLADRLARIYSQYMVYRPHWLKAWQQGQFSSVTKHMQSSTWHSTEAELLGPLWQYLHRDAGAHRGEIISDLIQALATDTRAPTHPLHVFGVSHLPPNELAALKAAALHRIVVFHVPDPCREYWAGLGKTSVPALHGALSQAQEEAQVAGQDDVWHTDMHPLLTRWGRLGRDYLLQLVEHNDRILVDIRHNLDDEAKAPQDRLARVQESIRQDQIDLLECKADLVEDASLRIHVCHTRVRELEAVRDAILDAIDRSKATAQPLQPSDIAVVAPNIGAYTALIPGVFGGEADRHVWPPYAISDSSTRAAHPLFAAFAAWLAMPGSRYTANQIINLIEQPAIARAYRLDTASAAAINTWLTTARATWGMDATQRHDSGAPEGSTQNSLHWATDRLLAGFIYGNRTASETPAVYTLPQGALAPAADIHGPEADALGSLHALLADLRAFERLASDSFNGEVWADTFETWLAKSFRIDLNDAEEKKALSQLRTLIQSLANESRAADAAPRLHFDVVRTVLNAALDASPSKGKFLRGGITFAGMVPQRAVPFRFIAVLGLNEGEFPRRTRDAGLDLMSQVHALGDRDLRSDDRWLFLETLMSARDQLHLSYLGRSASKGEPLNPATPLAELDTLLTQYWQKNAPVADPKKKGKPVPPWHVLHALQPFAPQYFTQHDPRMFSYNETLAGIAGTPEGSALPPFVAASYAADSVVTVREPLTLQQVLAYYKDPAKFVFRVPLKATVGDAADETLSEHEPLDAMFESRDTVGRDVLFGDIIPARSVPELPPAWLGASGVLPVGDAGTNAWAQLRRVLSDAWAQLAPVLTAEMKPVDIPVSVALRSETTLEGVIRHVWCDDAGQWRLIRYRDEQGAALLKTESFDFKVKVPLFMEWAALRLSLPDEAQLLCVFPHIESDSVSIVDQLNAWQSNFSAADASIREGMKADLRRRLLQLVQWAESAALTPLVYFPKTSHAAMTGRNASHAWMGSNFHLGEVLYSTQARLLGRGQDFSAGTAAFEAMKQRAQAMQDLIDVGRAE